METWQLYKKEIFRNKYVTWSLQFALQEASEDVSDLLDPLSQLLEQGYLLTVGMAHPSGRVFADRKIQFSCSSLNVFVLWKHIESSSEVRGSLLMTPEPRASPFWLRM